MSNNNNNNGNNNGGNNNNDMPPFERIGRGFITQYYNCLAGDRNQLGGVYRDNSLVTWSNDQLMGINNVMPKIVSLTFGRSQWKQDEIDCQPMQNNGIFMVIQGQVRMENEEHPLRYNDVQILMQDQRGWYIQHQIFRILGGSE